MKNSLKISMFWRLTALAIIIQAVSASSVFANWNGRWIVSNSGGSEIEIPSFLEEGPIRGLMYQGRDYGTAYEGVEWSSFYLRQYEAQVNQKMAPFVYLRTYHGRKLKTVTYSVDRGDWGVISGYEDTEQRDGFYAICRIRFQRLVCVDMSWKAHEKNFVAPMIDRIVRSFRRN